MVNKLRVGRAMKVVAENLLFPEGPVALSDGSVLVVEIARETLSQVSSTGKVSLVARIPGSPNGAAVGPDGLAYLCNSGGLEWISDRGKLRPGLPSVHYQGGSIEVVDLSNGKVSRLYDRCGEYRLSAPNDLVLDGKGGFWFTDYGKRRGRDLDLGAIYWAKLDGSEIVEAAHGLVTPNGIGLSPDGGLLYVAETLTGRIWRWTVRGPGQLEKRPWPAAYGADLLANVGSNVRLDSMAITASGAIVVAALDSRALFEIAASGLVVGRHSVPDLMVTNVCFGGPQLRTAFVTLSHEGRLAAVDWHESGCRLPHQTY